MTSRANNTSMKSVSLIETQALTVRCPTCGAGPNGRCELFIGGVRPESHLESRLIASDKAVRNMSSFPESAKNSAMDGCTGRSRIHCDRN